jgi:hypothetical protein
MRALSLFLAALLSMPQDTSLIPFRLVDHRGDTHTEAELKNRVVLILEADRGGSRFVAPWSSGIRQALGDAPSDTAFQRLRVADVRGVPSLLRPFIAGFFGGAGAAPTLLDWDGLFARAYDLPLQACNLPGRRPLGPHRRASERP